MKTKTVITAVTAVAALVLAPTPAQAQPTDPQYHSAASCDELYIAIQSEQDVEWRVNFITADGQTDELWSTEPRQANAGELSWTFEVFTDSHGTIIQLPDREYPSRHFAFDVNEVRYSTEYRTADGWRQANSDQDTWTGPNDCGVDPEPDHGDEGNCCYYEEDEAAAEQEQSVNSDNLIRWIQWLIDLFNFIW